ncbi:MAG: AI-2E family transporter [Candidatus Woesearchaeota archaeon]
MVRKHNSTESNRIKIDLKNSSNLVNYSIIFMATVVLVYVLKTFVSFIRPLVFAILLAILFAPLIQYSKKFKIPSYLTLIVIVLVFFTIFYFLTSLVVSEGQEIVKNLPVYQSKLNMGFESLVSNFKHFGAELKLTDFINLQNLNKFLTPIFQTTKNILTEILLVIIFLIFIVPFYNSLDTRLAMLLDKKNKNKFQKTLIQTEQSVRKYLFTKTIISLGTGIFSGFLIYFFGSDFAVSLAVIIFIFNYIPNIGSIIAVGLVSILLAFELGFTLPFWLLLIFLISIQMIFGNILEPLFEGKTLELSPLIIILSLFFWYWVWGIGGMVLAVPLTSIMKIIFEQFNATKKYAKFMGA